MSETVPLEVGISSVCSIVLDEATGEYTRSDATERIQCCLEQCGEPHSFCIQYCKEHQPGSKACTRTCDEQRDICFDTCELVDEVWTNGNPYNQCIEDLNCEGINVEDCIKDNKDVLRTCCDNWCVPTEDVDCDSFCNFAESVALMSLPHHLTRRKKSMLTVGVNEDTPKSGDRTFLYTVIGILIAFGVVGIWYMATRN